MTGERPRLRVALAAVLVADLVIVVGLLLTGDADGPRVLAGSPALLRVLTPRWDLVLPIAVVGLAALARFAKSPGRLGAGLTVLAVLGILIEARAANEGGPERFLFAGGTVLVGWMAGIVFVRASGGAHDDEERGAKIGANAALATIYVNAAVQKLLLSGVGWADGDSLRLVVHAQRTFGPSATSFLADVASEHRVVAFGLAAFVEVAQMAAVLMPFDPRARAIVGTMLIGFHLGVRALTAISFPQSIALLVIFSYPWERMGRGAEPDPAPLAVPRPARGAATLFAGAAIVVTVALLPPTQALVRSLSHRPESASRSPDGTGVPEPAAPALSENSTALALSAGDAVGPCTFVGTRTLDPQEELHFRCSDGELVVDVVPAGVWEFHAPRSGGGRDFFYRAATGGGEPAAWTTVLDELARREETGVR